MATIASLIVSVAADTAQLIKDVAVVQNSIEKIGVASKQATSHLTTMQDSFKKEIGGVEDIAKKAGSALAGMLSVAAVKSAVGSFVDMTSALTDLSQKTGISTTELQKLKYAAEQNGGTLDGVTTGITKMGKALVEGKTGTVDAMKALGLSFADVRNMDPATAFATIGDAIAKVPNPLERSKLAMELFGKSGADLLPMMTGNLSETMKAAETLGIILDEKTVKAGDDLGDTLASLQSVGAAVMGKVLAPMLPAFQMVATAMLGAGNVVDGLRGEYDRMLIQGIAVLKLFVDSAIKVVELGSKIPGLTKVLGDNSATMSTLKDTSTWLGGALVGVATATDTTAASTKAIHAPVVSLTKAQQDQADALQKVHDAQIPLTDAQKTAAVANEKLGVSAETTAKALGISADAVSHYLDSLKNGKEIEDIWRKFHEGITDSSHKFIDKWINDTTAAGRKVADGAVKALADQYLSSKDYQEKSYQLTLTGTALKIHQIERERDAQILAHGDMGGETSTYYQHQIDLAKGSADTIVERMRDAGVATRGDLQATADAALRNYQQMADRSEIWGKAAVKHQHDVAVAAQKAADGTKSAWDQTYDALGMVGDALGLIPGKMAAIGKEAVKTAQVVMDKLANGDVWGAVVAAAAGAVKVITGIWTSFFGTAGRDLVVQFADSMGGFDTMHAKLLTLGAAGEQLWIKLTQGVGRNNPEQAKAVIEEINKALAGQDAWMQRLPGLIEKYGLSWEDAGIKAKQAHLDEIAAGLIQDFADLSKAGVDVTLITEKMTTAVNDYVSQAIRTGTEIPAAMKPLLQKMIDMGVLTDDAGLKLDSLEGLTFAETLTQGFKGVVDAIKELTRALTGDLGGALEALSHRKVVIPVGFEVSPMPTDPNAGGRGESNSIASFNGSGLSLVSSGGGASRASDAADRIAADRNFLLVEVPKAITAAVQRAVA